MNAAFDAAGLKLFERGWLSSNCVLFDGGRDHEALIVDSGYCTHAAQTVALVRDALGAKPLSHLVNTHLHSDHCGGNHALQLGFGCSIDVPIGEVTKVDRWDESALTYRDTGQQCPRFARTGTLRDGDEIACGAMPWQVVAAPGHDPESIVLYQSDLRVLISADALWENGFGVVFPEIEGMGAFDDVRNTLNRLSALPIDWVIPGHGPPFQGFSAALARAHGRLDGFMSNPARHARHAAKVLIKFHLLEVQKTGLTDLRVWLGSTRYMRLIHSSYFKATSFEPWSEALLRELATSRSISISDGEICNI
ncbi:MAG: MBL fold metallo-hydrolase [Variovorax sp.]